MWKSEDVEKVKYEEYAKDMVDWFSMPEHYSVVHYGIERGMSKQELFKMGSDSEVFKKALDYAFSVQEYKVLDGIINGMIDRTAGLKMLETYNGWKGEVSIYQSISQSITPELAERLTSAIERMEALGTDLTDGFSDGGFGEVVGEVEGDVSEGIDG